MDQPTVTVLARSFGREPVVVEAAWIVSQAMPMFSESRRMNVNAIALFADELFNQYPHETLGDLNVFMRNAAMGRYGKKEQGKTFGALDCELLFLWFTEYLEDKALARERDADAMIAAEKRQAMEIAMNIPNLSEAVKATTEQARLAKTEAEQRRRIAHLEKYCPSMTDDQLREAWGIYTKAKERAIILREADHRKLLKNGSAKAE